MASEFVQTEMQPTWDTMDDELFLHVAYHLRWHPSCYWSPWELSIAKRTCQRWWLPLGFSHGLKLHVQLIPIVLWIPLGIYSHQLYPTILKERHPKSFTLNLEWSPRRLGQWSGDQGIFHPKSNNSTGLGQRAVEFLWSTRWTKEFWVRGDNNSRLGCTV